MQRCFSISFFFCIHCFVGFVSLPPSLFLSFPSPSAPCLCRSSPSTVSHGAQPSPTPSCTRRLAPRTAFARLAAAFIAAKEPSSSSPSPPFSFLAGARVPALGGGAGAGEGAAETFTPITERGRAANPAAAAPSLLVRAAASESRTPDEALGHPAPAPAPAAAGVTAKKPFPSSSSSSSSN
jgi:hypothetical protein